MMKKFITLRTIVTSITFLMLSVQFSLATDEKPAQNPPAQPAQGLLMEEVRIQGELERPDVFYIIPRRKARMDLGSQVKSFENEIMKALLPGPFEAKYAVTKTK